MSPSDSPGNSCALTPEAIKNQLLRILNSQTLLDSERAKTFLRYIVTQRIKGYPNGNGQIALKEMTIGIDVFGKPDFDPRSDSSVRAAATRLRKKLRIYYQTEGQHDSVLITVVVRKYSVRGK